MKSFAFAVPVLLFLSSVSFAKQRLLQITDPVAPAQTDGSFGYRGGFAGDLDLDGCDDFVLTAPGNSFSSPANPNIPSRVLAFSGRSGAVLWQHDYYAGPASLSVDIENVESIGLIDGDTIPDLVVSTPTDSSHAVLSGATGAILHEGSLHLGYRPIPSAAGDIDGDAFGDYFLTYDVHPFGAPPEITNGRLYVMSGATHQVIRIHEGSTAFGAYSANSVGDLNNDGRDDYAVLHDCAYWTCNPSYEIHSGLDGTILFTETSVALSEFSYSSIRAIADVDGDGVTDYRWSVLADPTFVGNFEYFEYRLTSGASGAVLAPLPSIDLDSFGLLGSMGDLNGDGRDELLANQTGTSIETSGLAILDLTSPTPIWSAYHDYNFLYVVGNPLLKGDINGDGTFDIMARSSGVSHGNSPISTPHRIVIFSGKLDSPVQSFCTAGLFPQSGCAGCPCPNTSSLRYHAGCSNSEGLGAILRVEGEVSLSNDGVKFELNRGPRFSFAMLASGNLKLPQQGPCAPGTGVSGTLSNGLRCIGGDFRRHGTRTIDVQGNAGIFNAGWGATAGTNGDLLSQSGVTLGQSRYFQAFYRDNVMAGCGTGINTTNAIALTPRP